MLGLPIPLFAPALLVAVVCASKFWNEDTSAARGWAVLCGGGMGYLIGSSVPLAWCWSARGCWLSLGDGPGEQVTLALSMLAAGILGGLLGLAAGWFLRRSMPTRKALSATLALGLLANLLAPYWLAR